jgi:hypothetical protein
VELSDFWYGFTAGIVSAMIGGAIGLGILVWMGW